MQDTQTQPRAKTQPMGPVEGSATSIELSILMPCLNEARTLAGCISRARSFLETSGIQGEVLVADNGSDDGSQSIALSLGARVIAVQERGYGSALRAGIQSARGTYVIMGDSDLSYDFLALQPFVQALRAGAELVVGNRFTGGIEAGAMPTLHRYLGNPVLSFLGRRFFGGPLRDFHCGLRGFRRSAMLQLDLVTPGMEFASEMIIKALQANLHVAEVPTTLNKDGRDRPPHLNTWRDGWRHLRFLLLYAPRWLFLYPGLVLGTAGLVQLALSNLLRPGWLAWPTGIHTQLFAAAAMVVGWQTVLFAIGAVIARHAARLDTPHPRERWAIRVGRSPLLALAGAVCAAVGFALCLSLTWQWGSTGFGALDPEVAMRQIIPGVALALTGMQALLSSIFFAALQSAFDSSRSRREVDNAAGLVWKELRP
jgi:glycosyltransferase involved in cell wall biosynthesis